MTFSITNEYGLAAIVVLAVVYLGRFLIDWHLQAAATKRKQAQLEEYAIRSQFEAMQAQLQQKDVNAVGKGEANTARIGF